MPHNVRINSDKLSEFRIDILSDEVFIAFRAFQGKVMVIVKSYATSESGIRNPVVLAVTPNFKQNK